MRAVESSGCLVQTNIKVTGVHSLRMIAGVLQGDLVQAVKKLKRTASIGFTEELTALLGHCKAGEGSHTFACSTIVNSGDLRELQAPTKICCPAQHAVLTA